MWTLQITLFSHFCISFLEGLYEVSTLPCRRHVFEEVKFSAACASCLCQHILSKSHCFFCLLGYDPCQGHIFASLFEVSRLPCRGGHICRNSPFELFLECLCSPASPLYSSIRIWSSLAAVIARLSIVSQRPIWIGTHPWPDSLAIFSKIAEWTGGSAQAYTKTWK